MTVCNGWDRVRDNNTGLTFGAQLTMAPTPDLTLVMNYIGGPERADNTRDQTRVYELVGTWKAHSRVALGLDALYATEPNVSLAATVKDVRWTGVAGYAKFTATKMFSLAFRGERSNDSDGVRTGTGQRLTGLTVTPEIKTASHFVVRGDLRFDRSNAQVFERRNALVTGQNTISVNLIYYF